MCIAIAAQTFLCRAVCSSSFVLCKCEEWKVSFSLLQLFLRSLLSSFPFSSALSHSFMQHIFSLICYNSSQSVSRECKKNSSELKNKLKARYVIFVFTAIHAGDNLFSPLSLSLQLDFIQKFLTTFRDEKLLCVRFKLALASEDNAEIVVWFDLPLNRWPLFSFAVALRRLKIG